MLKKLLGVPKESKFKADEFYSHNEQLNKKEKFLKSALEESEKLAAAETKDLRIFSTLEKEKIIDKAKYFKIMPPPMEKLLSAGIPLSSKEYNYLYRNVKRLYKEYREKERLGKQIEEQKRQKEIQLRKEARRKTQKEERERVQQEIKLKEMQEEKKKHLNQAHSKSKPLPFLFGQERKTEINIEWNESLRKVFIESGIDKENLLLNEESLLSIAKKLSAYFCEAFRFSEENNDISLALIMVSIKEYYDLNNNIQGDLQKKIKDKVFEYFKNELSKNYDLKLISKGQFGFKYSLVNK